MNRVIKFRAWDEYNEIMYYSDKEYEDCYFGFDKGVVVAWLRKIVSQTLDEPAHDVGEPIKVMQFTGLLDKNGTEIYQKDIFKSDDRVSPFEIVFSDGSFRGRYPTESDDDSPGFHFDSYEASHGEVIGNSLQHPDLLKKE